MAKLTYGDQDSNGDVPDLSLLYHSFRHLKTGGIYVLTDYVWNAKVDTWDAFYMGNDTPIGFTRTIREFFDGRFEPHWPERWRIENVTEGNVDTAQDNLVGGEHVGYQDDPDTKRTGEDGTGREGGSAEVHGHADPLP